MRQLFFLKYVSFFLIYWFYPLGAKGQNTVSNNQSENFATVFEYFQTKINRDMLVHIETYIPDLTGKNKLKEEYQPATLTIYQKNQVVEIHQIQIRTRGNVRKEVCDFPPLKLKFDSTFLAAKGITENNKLKLVLPCDWSDANQQRLFKEYAAYQLYEQLSDYHLETQLVRFQFAQNNKVLYDFIGFIIEEEEDYTARTGLKLLEGGKLRASRLDRKELLKMLLFQYLILNTDLSIEDRHNLEVAYDPDKQQYLAIPYDFDYSGLVDQPYAIPSKGLGIRKVTQPLFLMKGVQKGEFKEMKTFYIERKEKLINTVLQIPGLDQKEQKKVLERIDRFYRDLNDEENWNDQFLK